MDAPWFIFAVGLTYGLSFHRRLETDGSFKTYNQFFTRYVAIVGLGAIISAGETVAGQNPSGIDWGVLQSIGMAGLLTLPVINTHSTYRWIIGAGLLVLYQVILNHSMLNFTIQSPHGGLFGSINWAAMLILSTALADLFHDEKRGRKYFPWVSLGILILGAGLALLVPLSKHRVSSSYVLVTLGISALLFYLFHWMSTRARLNLRFLVVWGKNPLILYFFHYLLIGVFFIPGIPVLYSSAPPWLVIIEFLFIIGSISLFAYWLERHRLIIRL